MPVEAIHGYRAICHECEWLGPLRARRGEAVDDDGRHEHVALAGLALTALLHLAGHAVSLPAVVHVGRRLTAETHQPT